VTRRTYRLADSALTQSSTPTATPRISLTIKKANCSPQPMRWDKAALVLRCARLALKCDGPQREFGFDRARWTPAPNPHPIPGRHLLLFLRRRGQGGNHPKQQRQCTDYLRCRLERNFVLETDKLDGSIFQVNYSYDADDRRATLSAPFGTFTYSYDNLSRLVSLTNFKNQQFNFSYDKDSRLTGVAYPNGITTSYSYNLMSNVSAITTAVSGNNIINAT